MGSGTCGPAPDNDEAQHPLTVLLGGAWQRGQLKTLPDPPAQPHRVTDFLHKTTHTEGSSATQAPVCLPYCPVHIGMCVTKTCLEKKRIDTFRK